MVFNFRGRGGHALKTPRTYASSRVDDLEQVLMTVNERHPKSPILAVGVSMGGIMLGNYLFRAGAHARRRNLRGALLVSTCFDTFKGTESLERFGLNRLLNYFLASCLVETVKQVRNVVKLPRFYTSYL